MLNQYLTVKRGTEWQAAGRVDAEAVHPDGTVLVRINDKWFQLSECEGPRD